MRKRGCYTDGAMWIRLEGLRPGRGVFGEGGGQKQDFLRLKYGEICAQRGERTEIFEK